MFSTYRCVDLWLWNSSFIQDSRAKEFSSCSKYRENRLKSNLLDPVWGLKGSSVCLDCFIVIYAVCICSAMINFRLNEETKKRQAKAADEQPSSMLNLMRDDSGGKLITARLIFMKLLEIWFTWGIKCFRWMINWTKP